MVRVRFRLPPRVYLSNNEDKRGGRDGILDGKVAIVTGAGQGVGAGIALALAKEGASIVAAGRTEAKLHDICAKIEAVGARALAVAGDVMKTDDIARIVDSTLTHFGGIDILINNAQIIHNHPLDEIDERMFAEVFDSGPLATFRFMKAVRPHMTARGGGQYRQLGELSPVRWDAKGFGVYSAPSRRSAPCPAPPLTNGRGQYPRERHSPLRQHPGAGLLVRGRPGGGREPWTPSRWAASAIPSGTSARAVVFLVGPDASYVTGLTMPLDGGQAYFG